MTDHKKLLEEEKGTLIKQLSGLGQAAPGGEWEATPDTSGMETADQNSSADRFEDFEEKSALIIPLEARLKQVTDALMRLGDGTFGNCRVCGGKIEEDRLAANPAAETCKEHLES